MLNKRNRLISKTVTYILLVIFQYIVCFLLYGWLFLH